MCADREAGKSTHATPPGAECLWEEPMKHENKRQQYQAGYYKTHPCRDSFPCRVCGRLVTPEGAGSSHRNHCPNCLCSLHVDITPGDRAADCYDPQMKNGRRSERHGASAETVKKYSFLARGFAAFVRSKRPAPRCTCGFHTDFLRSRFPHAHAARETASSFLPRGT